MHVIGPDGTLDSRPEWPVPELVEIQALVDGYAEAVSVLWHGRRTVMFVNEEGLLKRLPLNPNATLIYANATQQQQPGPDRKPRGMVQEWLREGGVRLLEPPRNLRIVGTAVLMQGYMDSEL